MPEEKPVSFKAPRTKKKVDSKGSQTEPVVEQQPVEPKVEVNPQPEEPKNIPTEAPQSTEDWEAKIAAAKQAQQKLEDEEDDALAAAAARVSSKKGVAEPEPPKEETPKNIPEEKKAAPKAEKKVEPKSDDDDAFASYWDEEAGAKTIEGNKPYEPTEEELERANAIKGKKEDDASSVISTSLGTTTELSNAFEWVKNFMEKYKNLSPDDIEANPEIKETVEWLRVLDMVADTSLHTDQQGLLIGMIYALNKNGITLKQLDRKLSIAKTSMAAALNGQPKLLRGNAAIQMINNRYRGVYKVQLYNSGFWVKLTPLRNIDIDTWMQEIDFQRKQIGRLIGAHFYLGMNIYLKEKLADLLHMAVVDSNLEKWNEGTNLVDNISIHDYDTLCWAFSTMMHKDGVLISTVCVNPECKHRNSEQHLDLARCAFINPDVFTEEAMQWLIAGNAPGVIRSFKDIKHYKEKLLKNVRLIKFTETDQYELRDPSLGEFIRAGMAMLGKLAARVKDGKLTNDNEEVRRYAVYHLTKMLAPWISKIIINDESGKMVAVVDDQEAIISTLETSMNDKFEVIKQIEEFITNSKVSFFTAMNLRCPKCGHQPNLLKDNLSPLDVEYVLFCLSYLKLEQIGIER